MSKTELTERVDKAMEEREVHPHALRCLGDAREGKKGVHMFNYQNNRYCTGEFYCPMSEARGKGFAYCRRNQYARDVADRNRMAPQNNKYKP